MALGELGRVATVLLLIGFFLDALVLSRYVELVGADGAIEGLQLAGFFCYLTAVLLSLLAYFGGGDPLRSNRVAAIFTCVMAFLSVTCIVVGLIVCATKDACDQGIEVYATTQLVASATLALIAGILCVFNLIRKF